MREHRQEHTIARMAKVLGVSESGYFKWCKKNNAPLTEKEQEDIKITEEIFAIYRSSRGSYGSRKITAILNKMHKKPINHKRVERIMQECCLFSKSCKKYICTTDSDHDELIADNLIDRDFTAEEPDSKMLSDTTVITTGQGKLYVAGILDLYGDMPVGIAMSTRNDKKLVMDAFDDMILRQQLFDEMHNDPELSVVFGNSFNVEITAATANKGHSLLKLAGKLGIMPEQIMVCGDTMNDRTMFEAAGLAVAMGNADEEIKAMADDVTLSNDEDGVAAAIKKWVL